MRVAIGLKIMLRSKPWSITFIRNSSLQGQHGTDGDKRALRIRELKTRILDSWMQILVMMKLEELCSRCNLGKPRVLTVFLLAFIKNPGELLVRLFVNV